MGWPRQSHNAKTVLPGGVGALQFADLGLRERADGELGRGLRRGYRHRELRAGGGAALQLGCLQIVLSWIGKNNPLNNISREENNQIRLR